MRLSIIVVSDNRKKREAVAKAIFSSCSKTSSLDLIAISSAKGSEALEKVDQQDPNVLLCDADLEKCENLSQDYKERNGRNKIFLVFYENTRQPNLLYQNIETIDGFFCLGSIKRKDSRVCRIIAEMLSGKCWNAGILC